MVDILIDIFRETVKETSNSLRKGLWIWELIIFIIRIITASTEKINIFPSLSKEKLEKEKINKVER